MDHLATLFCKLIYVCTYVLIRIDTYLYVFSRIGMYFRYPILGGVPPGGHPPAPQPIHLWRLLFRLHSVAHAPFVLSIVNLLIGIAQSNLLLTVARVLLLLPFPRFPFHDSTGFRLQP